MPDYRVTLTLTIPAWSLADAADAADEFVAAVEDGSDSLANSILQNDMTLRVKGIRWPRG